MLDLDNLPDIDSLSPEKQKELLKLLKKYKDLEKREKASNSFLEFVKATWPSFISGYHHKIMADAFDRVANGTLKRLIINMPPRHTKSEFASIHLPAWFLGRYPNKKIIQASNTAELAVQFGRKVRDLLSSQEFRNIFPDVSLKADVKAAGRWSTNQRGEYYAIGVDGSVTGKGADLFIIDDPHSEQEAKLAEFDPKIYDKVYEWYTSGPRQRLQPGGAIVLVMTRWGKRDLTSRLLEAQVERGGMEWEVIELPAILPSGTPLWPEFWPIEQLLNLKQELPLAKWEAQYQQTPTSDVSALIKREWWNDWEKDSPPECEVIMASVDTAFGKNDRSNYSACTTWGVFYRDDPNTGKRVPSVILMDAWRDKITFPVLKERVKEHHKEWKPDILIIEGRAAGLPLIYELRAMGIYVEDYSPARGNDKISRVNSITDIFASGNVFVPKHFNWAEEVIEECAAFPVGTNDDYVDTVSQALLRFRQGGWVNNRLDDWGPEERKFKRKVYY